MGPVAGPRSVLGRVDHELPPVHLAIVEEPDRLGRFGLARQLDERKATRSTGLAVGGEVDVDDAPGLGEEPGQGVSGGLVAEVPDEDSWWNGSSPFWWRVVTGA